jgi:hypothetical protein
MLGIAAPCDRCQRSICHTVQQCPASYPSTGRRRGAAEAAASETLRGRLRRRRSSAPRPGGGGGHGREGRGGGALRSEPAASETPARPGALHAAPHRTRRTGHGANLHAFLKLLEFRIVGSAAQAHSTQHLTAPHRTFCRGKLRRRRRSPGPRNGSEAARRFRVPANLAPAPGTPQ